MKSQIYKEFLNPKRSFVEYFTFILCECLSFICIHTIISVEGSIMLSLSIYSKMAFLI